MIRILLRHWLRYTCVVGFALLLGGRVFAASGPQTFVYNGHLLDAGGNPVTTSHTVRFSLWTSADYIAGDVTATGAILTSAGTYAGWKEAFTVTPDARGYFSVQLGSSVPLPDFSLFSAVDFASLHLQVEVKAAGDPLTSYELLDQDAASESVDRSPLLAVPFALNADMLDRHHVGTGSGSIPVLGSGGLVDSSHAPPGTDRPDFILDRDSTVVSGSLSLQFGGSIAKKLSYDIDNGRFNFDDDVRVQGNVQLSGGLQLGSYSPETGTGAGTLRWTGTDFQGYDGTSWKSLSKVGKFAGTTTVSTLGSISYAGLIGYRAGNALCVQEYAGSHMCQVDEIIATVEQDMSVFQGELNGWASMGAPGYTADANDCAGWTSASQSFLGSWWEFSSDGGATVAPGGGKGFLTNCAVSQPVACCR